jgi:lysozyme
VTSIVEDLEADEGFRGSVYQDHLGFWTIGYGFMVDARKGGEIPPQIARAWLHHLIRHKAAQLDARLPWWKTQPDDVKRALLNMAYQMGVDGLLKFKATLHLLETGDRVGAAEQALHSLWARQTPLRAKRVTDLIRGTPA